jgi:DNA gyrase subunit A
MGRVTRGVRGIRLDPKDHVVAMAVVEEEGNLLTITRNGFGKRSPIQDYRKTHRGSKGVKTIVTNERNGQVIYVSPADDEEELLLTSEQGMTMRIPVEDIRIQGRNTMGVRIMRLNAEDKVVSVSKVINEEEAEDEEKEN